MVGPARTFPSANDAAKVSSAVVPCSIDSIKDNTEHKNGETRVRSNLNEIICEDK